MANREFLKKKKIEEERQKILAIFQEQMDSKFRYFNDISISIDRIKTNQDQNVKKIKEIDEKLIKFKETMKNKVDVKIDKSIKALEATLSNLIMRSDTGRSNSRKNNSNPRHTNSKTPQNDIDNQEENVYGNNINENEIPLDQFNQIAQYNMANIYGGQNVNALDREDIVAEVDRGWQELDSQLREYIQQELSDIKDIINHNKENWIKDNNQVLE